MGGTKKNNNNGNGLGPAKRKEHAKKSLQNRYKNDTEVKQLVKTIQETTQQQELLLEAKQQLDKSVKKSKLQKSRVENERNQGINQLGLSTFIKESSTLPSSANHANQLPATVDGFRRATSCMAMMVDNSKYFLDLEAGRQRSWLHSFIDILNKQKVAEDKMKLLQLGSDTITTTSKQENTTTTSSTIKTMKQRKNVLQKKINEMQLTYKKMSDLDCQRQKSHPKLSLEEYIALKHKNATEEIDLLRKSLTTANKEARLVRDALDQRHTQTKRITEEIARNTDPKNASTVEEHQLYKTFVEQNKKLVRQLEALTRKRNALGKEVNHVKTQIKEVKRARDTCDSDSNNNEEKIVRASIDQLREQYHQTVQWLGGDVNKSSTNAIDELRHQFWLTNISVKNLKEGNARTAEDIRQRTLAVNMASAKLDKDRKYNQSIVNDIESQANQMVQNFERHHQQQQQQLCCCV